MKDETTIKAIALYLPQYHPINENDEWWGKGFTEWTNVGKAKPLFKGHDQPKVPGDLGYYDLRVPEVRLEQARMAKEHGIDGFCYYHYWFGHGRQLLERPFNEVLQSGSPDFPFMLCWANESWHSKFWKMEGSFISKEMLMEQTYGDRKEYEDHFYALLEAFKDKRYIKIDNKPAFMIYKPLDFPEVANFIKKWQELAVQNGLDGIYFIGQYRSPEKFREQILNKGFDAVNPVHILEFLYHRNFFERKIIKKIRKWRHTPIIVKYKEAMKYFNIEEDNYPDVFPTIIPNWDHTPRSQKDGIVIDQSTPQLFKEHVEQVFSQLAHKKGHKICFIKSWNEWGEGNYMEPDLKYGKAYLSAFKEIKNRY